MIKLSVVCTSHTLRDVLVVITYLAIHSGTQSSLFCVKPLFRTPSEWFYFGHLSKMKSNLFALLAMTGKFFSRLFKPKLVTLVILGVANVNVTN